MRLGLRPPGSKRCLASFAGMGIAVAAAFAVLEISVAAPAGVHIAGHVPTGGANRGYGIVVSVTRPDPNAVLAGYLGDKDPVVRSYRTTEPVTYLRFRRGGLVPRPERGDTRPTVSAGLKPRDITLAQLGVMAGEVALANGAYGVLRGRRREMATLRALGWKRRQVRRAFMREFTAPAVASGLLAALVAYVIGLMAVGRPLLWWPLLSVPAAVAVTVAAVWWPVLWATGVAEAPAGRAVPAGAWFRRDRPLPWPRAAGRAVRSLSRRPARTSLGVLMIAVACSALALELQGLVGAGGAGMSWLDPREMADVSVVIASLAAATATVADLHRRTVRERAAELSTLRAIGWPAREVVWLLAWEAMLVGLAGGVAADLMAVGVAQATGQALPSAGAIAVLAGVPVVTGMALSALAAALGCARSRWV
jgi:putative ABC transport system permease protein